MKKVSKEELKKILENHRHWINEDCDRWETMQADLSGADLSGADLSGADLSGAYLRDADLRDADLSGADLSGADLRDAYLRDAYLRDADLSGADLSGAKNIPFIPMACPEVGSFIAYKNARDKIVELEVQSDSRRCSATTRKCRCDKAKVLRILNYDRTVSDVSEVKSNYDEHFIYRVGEIVSVDNFDDNRWNECSAGIHFFMSFQDAVDC